MDSKTIVDMYGAKLEQGMLFPDYDYILRQTPFKSISPKFDRDSLVHYWMNVHVPDGRGDLNTPYESYKTWADAVYKSFKRILLSGYNPKTLQQCVKLALNARKKIDRAKAELNLFVPHIKPVGEFKLVSIFEHTCSLHGIHTLRVYPERYEVWIQSYGNDRKSFGCTDLDTCLNHIKKYHYYD